jgi:hypothetical protein
MDTILLHGRSRDGPYPLLHKPSTSCLRHHLGNPSPAIISSVLRDHKLMFVKEYSESVCDACQKTKSQLPYPRSTSVSFAPL